MSSGRRTVLPGAPRVGGIGFAAGGALSALLALTVLTGCAAQPSHDSERAVGSGHRYAIPSTKPFVSEPTAEPSRGTAQGQIGADQASLGQLWALLDSGLHDAVAWPDRPAGQLPQDFSDFAAAITQRCEPGLTSDQVHNLEALHQNVTAEAARAGVDLTTSESAYFALATKDCM